MGCVVGCSAVVSSGAASVTAAAVVSVCAPLFTSACPTDEEEQDAKLAVSANEAASAAIFLVFIISFLGFSI